MGNGTKENPYTREDVLRLIKENGGTAEGLDLSEKWFENYIDLREVDLTRIILRKAHLFGVHLERAILQLAHLEEADLNGAHLEGAELYAAHLEGTYFPYAHLEGAYLRGVQLSAETRLENVVWVKYRVGEEEWAKLSTDAEDAYRRLKQWYTNAGVYDIAGEFFFREMEAKRKSVKGRPNPRHRAWLEFVSFICGYGERPLRVVLWAVSWVFGLALVYFLIGSTWQWGALWHSLYFSAVSFTALGYGSWLEITNDWIRGIGAFESFVGVFTIALFLITFTRKMRR